MVPVHRLRPPTRLRSRHLRAAVGCVLVALPLALGGAHAEVNAALAFVMTALLCVALLCRRGAHRSDVPITLVVVTGAIALAVTLSQIVPLPAVLVRVVAPGAHDVLTMSLGSDYRWAALSMDPPASCHEILKLIAYVSAAVLGVLLYRRRNHRRELLVWISVSGGTTAGLGFVHALARLDRPYGAFGYPNSVFVSSFINPNHLSVFLAMCSLVAVGLMVTARARWKWVHLGNAVVMGAGVVLTLSRGGILSYLGAAAFLGVLLAFGRSQRLQRLFAVQLCLAGALLVAGYLAYTKLVHEMWTLGNREVFAKTDIWRPVPAMLGDFPVLGIGRGAFASIYPKYVLSDMPATFTHLENEWLQLLVDWGPVAGGVLVVLAGWIFVSVLRRAAAQPTYIAGASALLLVAVHDVGDFSLAVSGIALPAVLMAATLTRARTVERPTQEARPSPSRFTFRVSRGLAAAISLGVLILLLAPRAILHSLDRDAARLSEVLASEPDEGKREEVARSFIERHPADYLLPLLVASRELREEDGAGRALRWVNRGMYLAPRFSTAHRLAGQALLRIGATDQALSEYRRAAEASASGTSGILREVWGLTRSPGAIAAIGNSSAPVRLAAARFLLHHEQAEAARAVAESGEESAELREVVLSALRELGETEGALAHAAALQRDYPTRVAAYRIAAQIQERSGDTAGALATLERGSKNVLRPTPILAQRARLLLRLGRLNDARTVARELQAFAHDGASNARAAWLLGQIYRSEGRNALALRELERARDFDPQNLGYRLGIASVRESIGDLTGARAELVRAQADFGSTPPIEQALARIESRAAKEEERLRWEKLVREEPW